MGAWKSSDDLYNFTSISITSQRFTLFPEKHSSTSQSLVFHLLSNENVNATRWVIAINQYCIRVRRKTKE